MVQSLIVRSSSALLAADQYPKMPQGRSVFFVNPDSFDLLAAINPHMRDERGDLRSIDKSRAREQWQSLVEIYRNLGLRVTILDALADCPDMVFCANQVFPFLDSEQKPAVFLSNMRDDTRHREVASIKDQLQGLGVRIYQGPPRSSETLFEGMGDALWVPGRQLICGGYGFRTTARIYEPLAEITGTSIALFELTHPKFYHLDTCLSLLDARTALACREGFTDQGWELLQSLFPDLIQVPIEEADAPGFACNAHSPDQRHVILQRGSSKTCAALQQRGFQTIEVDTDEFIKSGGSVFCLKMQILWDHWSIDEAI